MQKRKKLNMDLYKICLENSGNLIEKRISESEGYCLIGSVYQYFEDEMKGIFAVRKTKEEAIDALKEALMEEIAYKEEDLFNSKKKLKRLTNTVTYNPDSEMFVFGWGNRNIILQKKCYHYHNNQVHYYVYGPVQSTDYDFIQSLIFPKDDIDYENRDFFINKAVGNLDKDICLNKYKTIIYSKKQTVLEKDLLECLNMRGHSKLIEIESIDLMTSLPDSNVLIIDSPSILGTTMSDLIKSLKNAGCSNIVIFNSLENEF